VVGYEKKVVVQGVSLQVDAGEIVALIGHNGSGKSTTLKAIFGLLAKEDWLVTFRGKDITRQRAAQNVREGMAFVPQGRGIFADLTVLENLRLGAYSLGSERLIPQRLDGVYSLFPVLAERQSQRAGSLSGGEQQMLALGMALMLTPRLLILDEPSLGLAPVMVQKVMDSVLEINRRLGTTILLAEQNVKQALNMAHRVYRLKGGLVVVEDAPANLLKEGLLRLF
jgi:branched-chain amino acid transport system ATP-binding protein